MQNTIAQNATTTPKTTSPVKNATPVATKAKNATTPVAPKVKNAATVGWFKQCVHRSRNEVFSEVKTITPTVAEAILGNNPDNRNIRQAKLQQLVADMKNGRWAFNGEPVIVAKTGELNDGQHRLSAIVNSKTSQPILFVFGVERETRTTLDQGANRTPGDFLGMEGYASANILAGATRFVIAYERNHQQSIGLTTDITAAMVLDRVHKDNTLTTSARYAARHQPRMRKLLSPSIIAFLHNTLLKVNATEGMAFMEMLCTGEQLSRSDPAYRAREKLLNLDIRSYPSRIEIVFRAWNAYREKRTMSTIPVHGRLPKLI